MSLIEKLDPRTKLISITLFTTLVFFIDRLQIAFCLLLFFVFIRRAAGLSVHWKKSVKARRAWNLTLLVIFIVAIQAVFGPGDNYINFPLIGDRVIKWDGFIFGLVIVCRLFSIIIIFPVFTKTTPSYQIATGLNSLGFNYRSAFIITTVFNLIPLFGEEAAVIMDAQKSRGMNSFEKGRLIPKMKAFIFLAIPLVLSAMRKAQSSSIAMDSRAFGAYKTRTWLDKPKIRLIDIIVISACVIFCVSILLFNYIFL